MGDANIKPEWSIFRYSRRNLISQAPNHPKRVQSRQIGRRFFVETLTENTRVVSESQVIEMGSVFVIG